MAEIDFYITGVSYDKNNIIDEVEIRLRLFPITGKHQVEGRRIVSRNFIYDLLRTKKLVIYTATFRDEKWKKGDEVIIYGDRYITTAGNIVTRDNLENLPELK